MTRKPRPITFAWRDRVRDEPWGPEHSTPARTAMIAVAAVLEAHADPNGANIYPSLATIANEAGIGRNTANDALKALRNRHLLRTDGKARKGVIRYRLQLPEPEPDQTTNPPAVLQQYSSSTPPDTQPTTNHPKGGGGGGTAGREPSTTSTDAPAIDPTNQPAIDLTIETIQHNLNTRRQPANQPKLQVRRHDQKLHQAIATKLGTGWTPAELANEATCDLPTDPRNIRSMTALATHLITKLPNQPRPTHQPTHQPATTDHTTADQHHETELRTRYQHLPPLDKESAILQAQELRATEQLVTLIAPADTELAYQLTDAVESVLETNYPHAGETTATGIADSLRSRNHARTWRNNLTAGQPIGPFHLAHLPQTVHPRKGTRITPPLALILTEQPDPETDQTTWIIDPNTAHPITYGLTIEAEHHQREHTVAETVKQATETLTTAIHPTTSRKETEQHVDANQ